MKTASIFLFIAAINFFLGNAPDMPAFNGEPDSTVTISVTTVGDLMCHSVQYKYAYVKDDSFDFRPPFMEVKNIIDSSDFAFANFETVTAGKKERYSGYPHFNSPDDYITALKQSGFDLLTLANNHIMDKGEKGLRRTIGQIEKNNLKYTGAFLTEQDRDSTRVFNIKGLKLAVLAYTYGTNGNPVPEKKDYLVNRINYGLIGKDINKAKNDSADLVLVYYHFGEEYKREPVKFQKEVVDSTIKMGADIIIGGHPHVVEPTVFFKTLNSRMDTGFVIYSMGNFFSNQRWRYSDAGVILTLNITKDFTTDSVFIKDVKCIPTWVFKGKTGRKKEYLIIPSTINTNDSSLSFISKSDSIKMQQAYDDTREILLKHNNDKRIIVY